MNPKVLTSPSFDAFYFHRKPIKNLKVAKKIIFSHLSNTDIALNAILIFGQKMLLCYHQEKKGKFLFFFFVKKIPE
jgi:hypothetical protein